VYIYGYIYIIIYIYIYIYIYVYQQSIVDGIQSDCRLGFFLFIEDCCCVSCWHSRWFSHFTKEWPLRGCCASYPVPQPECFFARRCQLARNCNKSYVNPAGAAGRGDCGMGHESGAAGRIYVHIHVHIYIYIYHYGDILLPKQASRPNKMIIVFVSIV